ncbi:cell division protein ZapA [Candidatus Babeliales bacterium]|nr:cell division protein ZapA [Candidatus Babeliales bacterium]
MDKKRTLQISVFDKTYNITTDESEELVYTAAATIDRLFREVALKVNQKNESKIAVLVALKLAFELKKEETSQKELLEKVSDLVLLIDDYSESLS